MADVDKAVQAGLTLPASEWLEGFDRYYQEVVEHRIRLPRRSRAASQRTLLLGYAALTSTAITALTWLLGASSQLVGLMVIVTGALIVGAVQLRMAGTSMGARETRNFIVESMAQFLGLRYAADVPLAQFTQHFPGMGEISHTSIARCVDLVSGTGVHGDFCSVQLMGGTGPALTSADGQAGIWLGMPVEQVWDQYTVDGVVCHCTLPHPLGVHTISSDTRLTQPPQAAPRPAFTPTATGDEAFDQRFYIFGGWPTSGIGWLNADVRLLLTAIDERFGHCTLYVNGDAAYLTTWTIGDAYEISSLGFALKRQAHGVAETMRLARILNETLASAATR